MTLDEQIIFMEELLSDDDHWSCENAKTEYRQLQEWLKELKAWREWQTVYADSSIIVMKKAVQND